jgi:thiol:disulfide interchange protein DsbD
MKKLIFLLVLLFTSISYAVGQDELLHPDKAFSLAEPSYNSDTANVSATWTIAEKYYLYKKTFKFQSKDKNIEFGKVNFPEPLRHRDITEGKMVDIYRGEVSLDIPVKTLDGSPLPKELPIKIIHQGCFDGGVCYPPKKTKLTLVSDSSAVSSSTTSETKPIPEASSASDSTENKSVTLPAGKPDFTILGDKKNKPIPVDEAFQFKLLAYKNGVLSTQFNITSGHYIYKEKIKFQLKNAEGLSLDINKIKYPKTVIKNDAAYGEIDVYKSNINLDIPFTGEVSKDAKLYVEYQGCSELTGICYPPIKLTTAIFAAAEANKPEAAAPEIIQSEQGKFTEIMANKNFIIVLGLFFIAGVGLAFTPCVFPMIPILSGIIAGQSGYVSTSRAFILSLSYVIPMALTYAGVGVIAGLSGGAINLQVIFQTPWIIGIFAFLFVLLSLSMFGFYELQMPSSIQSRLTEISNRQSGGSILGAGIMGVLSAIIVGPCVTAPLIGALIYIAQTNDAVLGGFTLFALGLGMGFPLLIIGTSAGKLLPKAGSWMDATKSIFGVMMLGMAIWMIDRVVSGSVTLILTGILLLVSSIYAGVFDRLNEESSSFKRLFKGIGIVMFTFGLFMLIGAALGNSSLIKPLQGVVGSSASTSSAIQTASGSRFEKIKGISGLQTALQKAQQNKQVAMLDFYADWCASCKELEHFTFQDKQVIDSLKSFSTLQADVTPNDEQDKALLKKFGLFGPPAILFFDLNGKELKQYRLVGYYPAKSFWLI